MKQKSREEKIAVALGNDWKHVGGVGYCYHGNYQRERAVVDKAIRQRVRELCRQRGCELLYVYDKVIDEIGGWFHQILLKEPDGRYERRPPQYSEAKVWEEALLWLVERKDKK